MIVAKRSLPAARRCGLDGPAFTLIELLVDIAIVGILAGLLGKPPISVPSAMRDWLWFRW